MSYDGLHIYLVVAAHTNKLKRLKQFLIKSVGSLPPGDTAAMASARSNKRSVKSGGSASSLHSDDKMGVASAEETARETETERQREGGRVVVPQLQKLA